MPPPSPQPLLRSVLLAAAGAALAAAAASQQAPCDIYDADPATSCVAAHSTTRSLYASYSGALYQVRRASDHATRDIHAVGGVADALAQDRFCSGAACHIWRIYDQSERKNHLDVSAAPPARNKESAACKAAMTKTCGAQKAAGSDETAPRSCSR